MLFRLRAMPSHIVVVRFAGVVQLFDRLLHVFMDRIQIVPVTNLIGNRDPGSKRQTYRKNGNCNCFRHNFPSQSCGLSFPGHVRVPAILPDHKSPVKRNNCILRVTAGSWSAGSVWRGHSCPRPSTSPPNAGAPRLAVFQTWVPMGHVLLPRNSFVM